MRVDHLNYCRQVTRQFQEEIVEDESERSLRSYILYLCAVSTKFILPRGGVLFEDPDFKGFIGADEMHLPYEFTALEFPVGVGLKALILARERDDRFGITTAYFVGNKWTSGLKFSCSKRLPFGEGFEQHRLGSRVKDVFPEGWNRQLILSPLRVVFSFINALACSNVHYERNVARKVNKKTKAALPFDDYHILTVDVCRLGGDDAGGSGGGDGQHRSPREHLRRGHIRRYEKTRKIIWVNAHVVAAGNGRGKVEKDYMLRVTQPPILPQQLVVGAIDGAST